MTICEEIRALLAWTKFAVLATQSDGQPHASLMAFTPVDDIKRLVFSTYRKTQKYENMMKDGRVALLIGSGNEPFGQQRADLIVTAHGNACEVLSHSHQAFLKAHIQRHPEFEEFFSSPECALIVMEISNYQLVTSTDEVRWYSPEE
jgi:general stress protein 26